MRTCKPINYILDLWTLCAIVQSELLCKLWTTSYCVNQLCYILVNLRRINIKGKQRDLCYSSWLIVQKTILIKKNCLTCDHTTEEVLTTTNTKSINLTYHKTYKVHRRRKCHKFGAMTRILSSHMMKNIMDNRIFSCCMMKLNWH